MGSMVISESSSAPFRLPTCRLAAMSPAAELSRCHLSSNLASNICLGHGDLPCLPLRMEWDCLYPAQLSWSGLLGLLPALSEGGKPAALRQ